jgi:hypothetical protein
MTAQPTHGVVAAFAPSLTHAKVRSLGCSAVPSPGFVGAAIR